MRGSALVAALATLLCAHSAAADGATQALGAIGAVANFGLCLFRSAQLDEREEQAKEADAEKAELPYTRRGLVAGLGAAAGVEFFDGDSATGAEPAGGVAARAGFRCTERMSSELEYEWQRGFDVDGGHPESLWALTSNAKLHLLTGRVQPFALLGIGFLHGDIPGYKQRLDLTGRLGGGIDVYASEAIAISLDASYVIPTGNVQKLDYISLGAGVQYHF